MDLELCSKYESPELAFHVYADSIQSWLRRLVCLVHCSSNTIHTGILAEATANCSTNASRTHAKAFARQSSKAQTLRPDVTHTSIDSASYSSKICTVIT
jgi:hypothetical protein